MSATAQDTHEITPSTATCPASDSHGLVTTALWGRQAPPPSVVASVPKTRPPYRAIERRRSPGERLELTAEDDPSRFLAIVHHGRFGETIGVMVSTGTIRVGGLDVVYDRAGLGPPLVLVHGGAGDAREWRPQLAGLSDDFTVIAWDEPGAGRSSDVPADFGLAGYATALAALLEAVGPPAHVCGISWGGTVALELYRRRPQLVSTLVLADTYAGWKGSLPEDEVRARVAGAEDMIAGPSEAFDPTIPGLFAAEPPSDVIELLDAISVGVRRESLRVAVAAMAECDLRDVLPNIAVPTLLLWGELDARSPLTVATEFARAIPHAQLEVIPNAGHMSNLEQPEQFNAAIRAFCGRVR